MRLDYKGGEFTWELPKLFSHVYILCAQYYELPI